MKNIALSEASMTSLEIAELVGSRHPDVKRSIDRLIKSGIIRTPEKTLYENINNLGLPQKTKTYLFTGEQGRRDSYVVVARLSPQHIGAIIDAWGRTQNTLNDLLQALEAFDVPPEMGEVYVYAIRESETGRIKLGISKDPLARMAQLQTGNSQRLELVAYRKANQGLKDERDLHRKADEYHVRGEWFNRNALEVLQ